MNRQTEEMLFIDQQAPFFSYKDKELNKVENDGTSFTLSFSSPKKIPSDSAEEGRTR